ncbi:MAG: DNA double-strand break repair nuclease NurA [Candidatus Woesearchaeota archaeon]
MVKEIFSKIIDSIENKVLSKEISIDESRFVDVKSVGEGRIAFVDGGQAELLKAANFSLQFIRVAGLIFEDNKKKESIVEEFFVLISMNGDEYETEVFTVKGKGVEGIKINSFDETIREGKERASISKVGGIIRRFAEIDLAGRIDSNKVVLDGSLKTMIKGEDERMKGLLEKDKVIAALAKTSKLVEDGECILSQLKKEGEWYYNIGESFVVKLNRNSNYVFEFDINNKEKVDEVLGMLRANANDAVFPGYPYGLVMVDKIARISNEEKDYLLTIFKSQAGKKWEKISRSLNMLNAHEILDNIS